MHAPVTALYRAAKQALTALEREQISPELAAGLRGHVDRLYALAELESRESEPSFHGSGGVD
jgi:hypothetical protein